MCARTEKKKVGAVEMGERREREDVQISFQEQSLSCVPCCKEKRIAQHEQMQRERS